jgi:hypothetical protein
LKIIKTSTAKVSLFVEEVILQGKGLANRCNNANKTGAGMPRNDDFIVQLLPFTGIQLGIAVRLLNRA